MKKIILWVSIILAAVLCVHALSPQLISDPKQYDLVRSTLLDVPSVPIDGIELSARSEGTATLVLTTTSGRYVLFDSNMGCTSCEVPVGMPVRLEANVDGRLVIEKLKFSVPQAPTGLAICPQCDSSDFPDHSLFLPVVLLTACVLASHLFGRTDDKRKKIVMLVIFGSSSALIATIFALVLFVPNAVLLAKQIATMVSAVAVITIVSLSTGELMRVP